MGHAHLLLPVITLPEVPRNHCQTNKLQTLSNTSTHCFHPFCNPTKPLFCALSTMASVTRRASRGVWAAFRAATPASTMAGLRTRAARMQCVEKQSALPLTALTRKHTPEILFPQACACCSGGCGRHGVAGCVGVVRNLQARPTTSLFHPSRHRLCRGGTIRENAV